MIEKSQRWQRTALALAAATVLGVWSTQAAALSLGRLVVQSALGEPLRAEIEILDINDEEASSLRPSVALPDAFRANGMEYSAALNGLQISLQRRTSGARYLRLTNVRPVNEPFVDLVLEANWSSGRIVRDYTMLFDPPKLAPTQPAVTPQAPQVSVAPVQPAPAQEPPAPAPIPVVETASAPPAEVVAPAAVEPPAPVETSAAASAPAPSPEVVAPSPAPDPDTPPSTEVASPVQTQPVMEPMAAAAPTPAVTSEPAPVPPLAPVPAAASKRITVKKGDTAGRIAQAQKPMNVSLDQMLVAMLRANPKAFIGGNVNRVKAGAVLAMPGQEEAQTTSAQEAHQILVAQSKDFNEFRRRLAASAPASSEATADRKAGGIVQAQVEEKKPAPAAPDKLTLSKGSVQAKAPEDKLAQERSSKDASKRAEEVSKNVAELEKISKAATPTPTPAPAPTVTVPAAKPPVAAAPTPAPVAVPTPPPAAPAPVTPPVASSAPKPAATPAPASPPAVTAPVATPPASAVPAPAPAKKPAAPPPPPPVVAEPSLVDELLEEPLIPAAAGGLVVLLAGFAYYRRRSQKKTEQVDSAYLESRLQPDSFFGASGGQRIDTNNDAGASSSSSSMVYSPSQLDAGDDVDPVAEADVYLAYGRDLQAEEILKEALRTQPSRVAVHQKLCEIYAKRRDAKSFGNIAKEAHRLTGGEGSEWEQIADLGLSVDPGNAMYRSGGNAAPSAPPAPAVQPLASTAALQAAPVAAALAAGGSDLDLDLDFSLDEPQSAAAIPVAPTMPAPIATAPSMMEFDAPPLPQLSPEPVAPATPVVDNSLNFDLGGLSLDIGTSSEQPGAGSDDPLATKLALADEFKAIGDTDGARALIEEILAEATGDIKSRAQKALAALG